MKLLGRLGIMSATVLCLTLGATAPAFAQQEHEQKEDQKETARPEEKKAQPEKMAKPAEKTPAPRAKQPEKTATPRAAQTHENDAQREKTTTKTTTAKRQAAPAPKAQRAQPAQHATAGRIPADRYRAHFGREHTFHVSEADYSRNHRFQYGGYWFGVQDPWPSNWLYTQDVYVVEINGVYYLCNASFPGVNLALNITM